MSELTIITNNHRRDIVYYWELTDKEREEFDWIKEDRQDDYMFFRYKGNVYCLSDFMRMGYVGGYYNPVWAQWDGYSSDSFFSGILVKWPVEEWGEIDTDHVIVGWYYS